MESLGPLEIAVAVGVMFAAATVFSSIGFGNGLVAIPLLLLVFDTQTSIVILNTTTLVLVLLIYWNNREHAELRHMIPIGILGFLGAQFGGVILANANESGMRIAILVLILGFTALNVFNVRIHIPKPRLIGPFLGFFVGIMTASVGIGGPLLVLFMLALNWHRHTIRASMSMFFLFMTTGAIVGYITNGLYTQERIVLQGAVIVPAIFGFYLGSAIAHKMNERVFRYFVIVLIAASSLLVLTREVVDIAG